MKTIYIVWAETGEYDSYETWEVAAFTKKRHAEAFQRKCAATAQELYDSGKSLENNEYDPNCHMNDDELSYDILTLPLYDHFEHPKK